MKTTYPFWITGLLLCTLVISCSKMNDLHEIYLLRGEKVYLGQPDSIAIRPGLNRVEIKCWTSDPKAGKMKIYWNNGADSITGNISSATDEGAVFQIENLEAKNQVFRLVVYDKHWEDSSIPLDTLVEVYGDSYLARLFPRQIRYAQYLTSGSVHVGWGKPTEKCVASVITYTDLSGKTVKKTVPTDATSTVLEHFKGDLNYYTAFIPADNALDTLYSVPERFTKLDVELDKSLFKRWNPPYVPYPTQYHHYGIEYMWDGVVQAEPYFLARDANEFTFDLGQTKKINRVRQWKSWNPGHLYGAQQIKRFTLFGSASPDVGADLSEWTFLGSFQCIKPSGKPNEDTDEDMAHVLEGDVFLIHSDTPVRYIRYQILELWKDGGGWFTIGEMSFFTTDF